MRRSGSLEELYDTHLPQAVRLAYVLTGDERLAQDLAHDAFVRLLTRFRDLHNRSAFGAYLRTAVVNLARDHHRRSFLRRRHEATQGDTPRAVGPPDVGLAQDLWQALQHLPHRQRAAIVLRYYEDLSEVQTGEILGCSPGAVKSLVARGMGRLRSIVEEMELR